MNDSEKLKEALDLLSRYYWTESKREGARTDRATARFFERVGEPWRTRSFHPDVPLPNRPGETIKAYQARLDSAPNPEVKP